LFKVAECRLAGPDSAQIIANAKIINPNMPTAMIVFVALSNWISPTVKSRARNPRLT
jgi:hypothetical protein